MAKHSYSAREILLMKAECNRKIKQVQQVILNLDDCGVFSRSVTNQLHTLQFKVLEYTNVMANRSFVYNETREVSQHV